MLFPKMTRRSDSYEYEISITCTNTHSCKTYGSNGKTIEINSTRVLDVTLCSDNRISTLKNDIERLDTENTFMLNISSSFLFLAAKYNYGIGIYNKFYPNLKLVTLECGNTSKFNVLAELSQCKNLKFLEINEEYLTRSDATLDIRCLKVLKSTNLSIERLNFPKLNHLHMIDFHIACFSEASVSSVTRFGCGSSRFFESSIIFFKSAITACEAYSLSTFLVSDSISCFRGIEVER